MMGRSTNKNLKRREDAERREEIRSMKRVEVWRSDFRFSKRFKIKWLVKKIKYNVASSFCISLFCLI